MNEWLFLAEDDRRPGLMDHTGWEEQSLSPFGILRRRVDDVRWGLDALFKYQDQSRPHIICAISDILRWLTATPVGDTLWKFESGVGNKG